MNTICAILSLLHEPAAAPSAIRRFRDQSVLSWTLRRLRRCKNLGPTTVLCWEDQLPAVKPIAAEASAFILAKGPRCELPAIEAIAASLRWSDGWRGGPLGACCFDQGFHAPWMNEIPQRLKADGAVVIDPAAGLVDPSLVDRMIDHVRQHSELEWCFAPAAPGLCGLTLSAAALGHFAQTGAYPGRMLNYSPDVPGRDPVSGDECLPIPTPVARTLHRFTLDSRRQLARMDRATSSLNGTLICTGAEQLVACANRITEPDALPREITIEINTTRSTCPIYWPGRQLSIARPEMSLQTAARIFDELAAMDDLRLTLGGVGDPLLAADALAIIRLAQQAGIRAIHVETDLLDPTRLAELIDCGIDVLSVYIPAISPETYQDVMGAGGFAQTMENIQRLLDLRQAAGRGVPIIAPTFVKCRRNLHEMEAWYDHWLRAVGTAVIVGPTDCAGQIADTSAADMSPPARVPCRRLQSRLTILSDGRIVSCEQDVIGRRVLGQVGANSMCRVWQSEFGRLRAAHADMGLDELCTRCREWHRP